MGHDQNIQKSHTHNFMYVVGFCVQLNSVIFDLFMHLDHCYTFISSLYSIYSLILLDYGFDP